MRHLRMAALAAAVAVGIATLAAARPVAADALYPGDSAGTWTFSSDGCDAAAWSRTFELWYVVNPDPMDYVFDIPDPDFAPGESVQVELEPTVVGTLNGSVTLTGADTFSGVISGPEDTWVQDRLGEPAEFTLTFTPGTPTTGELPVPDFPAGYESYAEYTGFAAARATITIDGGAKQTIVMLAQGFKACETVPNTAMATHADRAVGTADGVAPAAFFALATWLLMLGVANARALRRRQ